ncbi:protein ILRUN-like [Tachypleus tridentatus]|uniref:protein ILRUN-like n=1 Tax=Tachypleus tridentatus TaxID=6853 RepID=UPI003FD6A55D
MDIDSDLDANLLQQFSCMGTTDRDILISQLQKLLGNQLNPAGCAFFLDMNNWNLQAAVCSYFDFEAPLDKLPSMSFVKDVTIGEGEAVPPNTRFVKTWRIQNPGDDQWPPGCCLRFTNGHRLGCEDRVLVEPLKPKEAADVSIEMLSPDRPGIYQGQWRMSTATGQYFGEVIWVIVTVAEGGLLGVTQQMDAFHQLGQPPRSAPIPTNPFATTERKYPFSTSPQHPQQEGGVFPQTVNGYSCSSPSSVSPSRFMYTCSNSLPSSPVRRPLFETSSTIPQLSSSLPSSQKQSSSESGSEDMML